MRALIVLVLCISAIIGTNIYNVYLRHEMLRITEEHNAQIHEEIMKSTNDINRMLDILEKEAEKTK